MKNKLFYFLCGFCMMWLIAIVIITKYPEPEGDIACGKCGAYEWYFKIADGEEY